MVIGPMSDYSQPRIRAVSRTSFAIKDCCSHAGNGRRRGWRV